MDFETTARRGLSRAVLYAQKNDVSMHRDFLIHACLNNIAYDTQLSGDQSQFMFDIIHATGDVNNHARGILDAMRQATITIREFMTFYGASVNKAMRLSVRLSTNISPMNFRRETLLHLMCL